jgi:hypothetical protein
MKLDPSLFTKNGLKYDTYYNFSAVVSNFDKSSEKEFWVKLSSHEITTMIKKITEKARSKNYIYLCAEIISSESNFNLKWSIETISGYKIDLNKTKREIKLDKYELINLN